MCREIGRTHTVVVSLNFKPACPRRGCLPTHEYFMSDRGYFSAFVDHTTVEHTRGQKLVKTPSSKVGGECEARGLDGRPNEEFTAFHNIEEPP